MKPLDSRRILLVDDDPAVLRASTLVLERAGFSVHAVASGAAALRALDDDRYSVIVSDIMMDGMTGIDLLRMVKEREDDIPVILITGGPTLATAIDAMNHGAHRYLLKPVAFAELIKVVQDAAKAHDASLAAAV